MSGLPCPNCGSELTFLEQYRRHYCYMCGRYSPEGYGERGAPKCPTCAGVLSFVAVYDRHFCYRCNIYPDTVPAADRGALTTPTVGRTSATVAAESSPVGEEQIGVVELGQEPKTQEEPEEEIPDEQTEPIPETPGLSRSEILEAKKPRLMDLCKAYSLDSTGTKEQLRERLLSYVDEEEAAVAREAEAETFVEEAVEAVDEVVEGPSFESEPEEIAEDRFEVVEPEPSPSTPETSDARGPESSTIWEPATRPAEESRRAPRLKARAAPVTVVEPPATRETPRTEHPCPTCGRELEFITQYGRWYCYHCKSYAPASTPKNACPNCGATLRWIGQYARWWCDSCREYAPAYLPRPRPHARAVAAVEEKPALRTWPQVVAVHRHRDPGSGIGLVAFGLLLFVLYELLVDLPAMFSIDIGITMTNDITFALRFFAFSFVAAGAMIGLAAVKDRR